MNINRVVESDTDTTPYELAVAIQTHKNKDHPQYKAIYEMCDFIILFCREKLLKEGLNNLVA